MTEKLHMLPALSRSMTPRIAVRMWRWLAAWAKLDPAMPHWHLGPLAVDPLHQRRGIGTRLLRSALARVDASGGVAYLETDSEANVAFYRRFGFVTVATTSVVGVPSWFMLRPSSASLDPFARPSGGRPVDESCPTGPAGRRQAAAVPAAPVTPMAPLARGS